MELTTSQQSIIRAMRGIEDWGYQVGSVRLKPLSLTPLIVLKAAVPLLHSHPHPRGLSDDLLSLSQRKGLLRREQISFSLDDFPRRTFGFHDGQGGPVAFLSSAGVASTATVAVTIKSKSEVFVAISRAGNGAQVGMHAMSLRNHQGLRLTEAGWGIDLPDRPQAIATIVQQPIWDRMGVRCDRSQYWVWLDDQEWTCASAGGQFLERLIRRKGNPVTTTEFKHAARAVTQLPPEIREFIRGPGEHLRVGYVLV